MALQEKSHRLIFLILKILIKQEWVFLGSVPFGLSFGYAT
ncbi:MAG: hypothetical protein CM1200mP1_11160 [Candidatus Neomarinimicrobiota bacterium]|nr:MAG: hypothetical protein CM1200mP1_11160 [Candidatus Neomarinimicrobiota bacterium]